MVLAEVARAAERLYREYALEAVDETVEIALRDGGVRRDLERAVARALTLEGAPPADVAESLLAGGVAGSEGGRRHALALAALRSGPSRRPPPATEEFVARAAVPSLWGDTYAAATLEDGRGALFRVLAQVELAPAGEEVGGRPPAVTVDRRFSGDAGDAPSLQTVAATAVAAAFDVLQARAVFPPVAPPERARAVRLWRGGLPWPLAPDTAVPTPFQRRQDGARHDGPSLGLAVALAVLHAFLPQWTLRTGPLCAATGEVTAAGTVEAVGELGPKTAAAAAAEVAFLHPARGSQGRAPAHFRHSAVETLEEAAAHAFALAGPDVATFLGQRPERLYDRDGPQAVLARAWERVRERGPRLVVVHGGSGIGKSALVASFVSEAAAGGASAVVAGAKAHETRLFEPVARRLVDGLATAALRRHARDSGRWLASMVEPLAAFLPDDFGGAMVDPTDPLPPRVVLEKKAQAIGAVAAGAAAARGRLLLVLDDLQWGGEETWPILRRLLDPARPDPVLVVATYRPDALDASPDVEPTLAELRARGVVEEVGLEGLSGRSIRSWVSSNLGGAHAADAVSAALEEVTAGNPFELVTHLRQVVEEAQGGGADPVATVYRFGPEVVDKRLRVFAGLRTLQLAAMVRHAEFSAGLLQEAGAVPPASLAPEVLARDLAAAVAARFVKPAGPGRYTFEHDRTLEAVRRTVPVEQGGRDNLALGLVLERRAQAEGARLPVVDLARYFGDAAPVAGADVWKRALSYAEQAAEEATRRLTYGEVLEFRQRAVDAFRLGEVDLPEREAGLLLEAGRAYSYVGAEARSKPYFEEARDIALDVGLGEVVVEATLGFAGPPEDTGRIDDRLIRWLEDAATRAEAAAHPRAARLRGRAQFERVLAARREPGAYSMPPVADMLERARHGGEPVGLAWALLTRLFGLYTFNQRPSDRLALADEALAVAAGCGERDVQAWAQGFRAVHLLELGDRAGAEEAVSGLAELGPLLHHGYARWGAAVIRPLFAHLDGRFAEARRLSDHAFTLRGDSSSSVQYQYVQRMLAFREEGNFAGIRPLLEWMGRVLPSGPLDGIVLPAEAARAVLACDLGRLDEARGVLDRLAAAPWERATDDPLLSTGIAFLSEACAATGDLRLVPTLYSLLHHRTHETIVVALAVASLGSVDRYLGILAGLDRRWDDAESHFAEALEVNGIRLRSPTWEAHTQVDFAAMLARRRATGDRERARELAAAAAATAARLPMPPVLNRARALLSRLGPGL